MRTRTKENADSTVVELEKGLEVPESVKTEISEKGFFFYEWVTMPEFLVSLQADFFNILSKMVMPIGVTTFIVAVILYVIDNDTVGLGIPLLYLSIPTITILIGGFLYAVWKTLEKSIKLQKSGFAVFMDDHMNVAGNFFPYSEYKFRKFEIDELGNEFNEKLLAKSSAHDERGYGFESIKESFGDMFSYAYKLFSNIGHDEFSAKWAGIILLATIASFIFTFISVLALTIVGIPVLSVIALIAYVANSAILKFKKKSAMAIGKRFGELDSITKTLESSSEELFQLAKNAGENDWKNGLSERMNGSLNSFNGNVKTAMNELSELKEYVESSEYAGFFNYEKYSVWVKKNLLRNVLKFLETVSFRISSLYDLRKTMESDIANTENEALKTSLGIKLEEIARNTEELEKQAGILKSYAETIRSDVEK